MTRGVAVRGTVWSGTLGNVTPPAMLERELYTESEAARLLGLPQSTLRYWLEGLTRKGAVYPPIIRPVATGRHTVTWAEFVEAGLLSMYRRRKKIPMDQIRDFITSLREEVGVPYPLAHSQP